MSLPTFITVTITDQKAIAGFAIANARVDAAQNIEDFAANVLTIQGREYRDQMFPDAITSAAFISRFTPAEYAAIITASETDSNLAAFVAQLTKAPVVWLLADIVRQGVAYLVATNYLTQARADKILEF